LKLAVNGAAGRMGRRIVALAVESGVFEVVSAAEHPEHPQLGRDAGTLAGGEPLGVPVTEALGPADVIVDFSLPAGTVRAAEFAAANGVPLVVGTTGLGPAEKEKLAAAAQRTAVLVAANMSLGVNLLFKLVSEVATCLGEEYDIEIVETHHRFKKDAPSGTALELARRIAQAKGWVFPGCLRHGREGGDARRSAGTLGMHAVRLGDTVGVHSVLFGSLGETVELKHTAHTRDTFARGALRAARWLAGRPAGSYSMSDVLGL